MPKFIERVKRTIIVLALSISGGAAALAQKPFDASRDPAQDLAAAELQASREHKNILLDVGGNWCGWCLLLDRTTHGDPALNALLEEHFVVLHVNWSPENENKVFLDHYPKVAGYPHFFVLDPKGKLLISQDTSIFETDHKLAGGYNVDTLKSFLRRCSPGGTA